MTLNKREFIEALGSERCTVNEQILKTTTDFIFEDSERANDFIRRTDPVMLKRLLLNMTGKNEHNQDIIQNDQPENNEIGDNEIVTEAGLIEEQPEIQNNESGL